MCGTYLIHLNKPNNFQACKGFQTGNILICLTDMHGRSSVLISLGKIIALNVDFASRRGLIIDLICP